MEERSHEEVSLHPLVADEVANAGVGQGAVQPPPPRGDLVEEELGVPEVVQGVGMLG